MSKPMYAIKFSVETYRIGDQEKTIGGGYYHPNRAWDTTNVTKEEAFPMTFKEARAASGNLKMVCKCPNSVEPTDNKPVAKVKAPVEPVTGHRIGWLDSARMAARIHRTTDDGVTTVCGHDPLEKFTTGRWVLDCTVPRTRRGRSAYCGTCFKNGGKTLPWFKG